MAERERERERCVSAADASNNALYNSAATPRHAHLKRIHAHSTLPHAAQPLSPQIPLQLPDVDQGGQPKTSAYRYFSAPTIRDTTAEHHKHKPIQIATNNRSARARTPTHPLFKPFLGARGPRVQTSKLAVSRPQSQSVEERTYARARVFACGRNAMPAATSTRTRPSGQAGTGLSRGCE
jgi:hypothetical protein